MEQIAVAVGQCWMSECLGWSVLQQHEVQMLLGVFSAKGVLPLEFKPAHSVGDLLTQHLDELEQEAEPKGGVIQALSDHFSRVYKIAVPLSPAA